MFALGVRFLLVSFEGFFDNVLILFVLSALQDVADYEIFVQRLVKSMEADKQVITRKYRMAEAKLKISRDPKRIQVS